MAKIIQPLDIPAEPLQPHTHNLVDSPGIDKVANGLYAVGRMHISGAQTIANTTDTKVNFNVRDFESGSIKVDLTNHRFIATMEGYYFVSATVYYDSPTATKNYITELYINGDTGTQKAYNIYVAPNTTVGGGKIFGIVHLNKNNYAEIYTYHNTGSNSNTSAGYPYVFAEIFKL